MPLYVKLSVDYSDDDKVCGLSPFAELMFIRGLCFAKRLLTDGFLTKHQIRKLCYNFDGLDNQSPEKVAAELVNCGLWEDRGNGYQIVAWLKHNKSADEIEQEKELTTNRVRRHRMKRECNAVTQPLHISDVTACNAPTETETETETETIKNKRAASPPESKPAVQEISFPPELDQTECRTAFERWCAYRKQIRKPLRPASMQQLLTAWARAGPTRFVQAVNHSIAQGWQGLYEPKSGDFGERVRGDNPARARAAPGKYDGVQTVLDADDFG